MTTWNIETVADTRQYTVFALVVRSDGLWGLSNESDSDLLSLAHRALAPDSTWSVETIPGTDDIYIGNLPRGSAALAIDTAGHPHIAYGYMTYGDITEGGIKHLTNTSGSWVSEIVDSSPVSDPGGTPSFPWPQLALSGSDIHLAYHRNGETGFGPQYALCSGGTWMITDLQPGFGEHSGIVRRLILDGAGHPHVCVDYEDNMGLAIWHYDGESWSLEDTGLHFVKGTVTGSVISLWARMVLGTAPTRIIIGLVLAIIPGFMRFTWRLSLLVVVGHARY